MRGPRVAVVGHTEHVELAYVAHLPRAGEIVHATDSLVVPAAGGGAVAAVQARRILGSSLFLTAVGADAQAEQALSDLRRRGVALHAVRRPDAHRRAFTHVDADAQRTITVLGPRSVPRSEDELPWDALAACDAVYFTGGDAGALHRATGARAVVATARAIDVIAGSGARIDVLVASAHDPGERFDLDEIDPRPGLVVLTEGRDGGSWSAADGTRGRWAAAPVPGPAVDAYGCGDSFAAGLTCALAAGAELGAAIAFAARCGAWCLAGRGPYGHEMPPLARRGRADHP